MNKNQISACLRRAAAVALSMLVTTASGAGFQHGYAADPDGKPLEVGIWYPSEGQPGPLMQGPTTMTVVANGPVAGRALPLVVMSHGTGGSYLGHDDTAIALADAGYVVAAVTHAGDNYADQSRSTDVFDRPRQISRVIDHLLSVWNGHARIDPERVGIFGFSAGGLTALIAIGGVPDLSRVRPMCALHPTDFACEMILRAGVPLDLPTAVAARDLRIKSAVIAAPALGYAFAPDGLKNVEVPVQLWRAELDAVLPQPRYAEAVRLALPVAPEYHVVPGAGHFDFLAPCSDALASIAPAICARSPTFDRVAFHRTFNADVVRFFDDAMATRREP